ncbi:MAG: hypothetical protein E6J06_14190 [Chloroflexi bacterium]|nr:MAG: hypothetical protein E6J06_14190 [Chloroflexota bacterium]
MKVTITTGTLFIPTPERERYQERNRFDFDVPPTATISDLIELIDEKSPPRHPGFSYLSLQHPHGALPESATLAELNLRDGATLRVFSSVR